MGAVKFGTDGWRGIIADDYTHENVRVAARAIAHYVLEHEEDPAAGVCIGWDTRFKSQSACASVAAGVLTWRRAMPVLPCRPRDANPGAELLRCASAGRSRWHHDHIESQSSRVERCQV